MRSSAWAYSSSLTRASASATSSMREVAFCSKPICQLARVARATAMSTPGSFGAYLRVAAMIAMATTPMTKVGRCVSPACSSTPQMSWMKCSERPIGTPRILFSCDSPMISAAALVKPTMTGCERKFTTTPSLKTPSDSCTRPTSSASMTASAMNCSDPGAAKTERDDAVSRETTATGPVPSWLEEPHRAATITGRKAAYRP